MAAYHEKKHLRRKYLAASTDGLLMAVLKHTEEVVEEHGQYSYMNKVVTRVHFEVQVLDQANGRWEAADMGAAALFVGVNGTVCVSAREHRGIAAGCIYFTDDEVGDACLRHAHGANYQGSDRDDTELRVTGVYSLKLGKVIKRIPEKGEHPRWPPPAWFTPSFL
ncbi:hypothetical protein C2845_PM15G01230 [Panicum miliaceum]|uniref:KIB1-4 beta-propeller domain-containing protein n=1 Tax=Panicum miliaceum TaxID=4540 RepID=A0A3L6Q7D0_PANMI|nr:hypothetical protein C2845_PM15G01230 [Panicum miliaceum]